MREPSLVRIGAVAALLGGLAWLVLALAWMWIGVLARPQGVAQ